MILAALQPDYIPPHSALSPPVPQTCFQALQLLLPHSLCLGYATCSGPDWGCDTLLIAYPSTTSHFSLAPVALILFSGYGPAIYSGKESPSTQTYRWFRREHVIWFWPLGPEGKSVGVFWESFLPEIKRLTVSFFPLLNVVENVIVILLPCEGSQENCREVDSEP